MKSPVLSVKVARESVYIVYMYTDYNSTAAAYSVAWRRVYILWRWRGGANSRDTARRHCLYTAAERVEILDCSGVKSRHFINDKNGNFPFRSVYINARRSSRARKKKAHRRVAGLGRNFIVLSRVRRKRKERDGKNTKERAKKFKNSRGKKKKKK